MKPCAVLHRCGCYRPAARGVPEYCPLQVGFGVFIVAEQSVI